MDNSDPLLNSPLLADLHRRHPNVDLVVLPPPPPRPTASPIDVPDEVATRSLARVSEQLTHVWRAATGDVGHPVARWHYAADPGWVRASARISAHRPDGLHLLVALRAHLEQQGWEVTRPPSAVERLVGRFDELELTASFAETAGIVLFNLAARPLNVGAVRARSLVRRGGEH